jgi:tetratricopeptide (TPR) repeat protein
VEGGVELSPSRSSSNSKNNIILFPHTIEHHLNEAIEAGNKKDYQEALRHFEQILRYDPNHLSGKIGLAVTWIEMKKYKDAIDLTSEMLEQGQGDYYHILRIHVAALLQSEQYSQLKMLLTKTLNEKNVPLSIRSECESLLEACGLLDENVPDQWSDEMDGELIRQRIKEQPQLIDQWIKQLYSDNIEKQFLALEQLQYTTYGKAKDAVLKWVGENEGDPLLKTLALRTLHKMGVEGTVLFKKWGRIIEIDMAQFPSSPNDFPPFVHEVTHTLNEEAYHQDPTLAHFSSQVWMEYLYTIYPHYPELKDVKEWAAALHYVTAVRLYQEVDFASICDGYDVDGGRVKEISKEIEMMISERTIQ